MYHSEKIQKAIEFAINAHKDQKRKGDYKPYIIHPIGVALILAKAGADDVTIAAGLLHDVLEDTATTKEELVKEFGEEVVRIIDDVTEHDKSHAWKVRKLQAIEHAKEMGRRSLLVKTADKIDNLRSLYQVLLKDGLQAMERFNAPLPDQIEMDKRLYKALKRRGSANPLLPELKKAMVDVGNI